MEYVVIEGEVTLVDNLGNTLSTISGINGPKLEVVTELATTVSGGAINVREQNLDPEGYIKNSSHNMAHKEGNWAPLNLDTEGRLRVVTEVVAQPHTLSGTGHIGYLADAQIPENIVRDYELLTTSGTLRYDIEHIDGGAFI